MQCFRGSLATALDAGADCLWAGPAPRPLYEPGESPTGRVTGTSLRGRSDRERAAANRSHRSAYSLAASLPDQPGIRFCTKHMKTFPARAAGAEVVIWCLLVLVLDLHLYLHLLLLVSISPAPPTSGWLERVTSPPAEPGYLVGGPTSQEGTAHEGHPCCLLRRPPPHLRSTPSYPERRRAALSARPPGEVRGGSSRGRGRGLVEQLL